MSKTNTADEHWRLQLIAAACALQQHTSTAANIIPIPYTGRFVAIGTPAEVARLLEVATAAPAATVTLDGHQLREALDFLNPDGDDDSDQRDEWLTFGVRQHRDDDGTVSTGMCCWNEDTDGVLPLQDDRKACS